MNNLEESKKILGISKILNESLIPDEEVLAILKNGFADEFFIETDMNENEKYIIIDGSELIYDKLKV